jgi:hypothetical protein
MKMNKKLMGLALTGLLTFGAVTGASASVTYDTTTGFGTVGKGDVQLTLGYNNTQMQANATSLVFTQESVDTYDVVVEWYTGSIKNQKHHIITQHKTTTLNDYVSYDLKVKKQVVGFNLTGIDSTTVVGDNVPVVGEFLVDNDSIQKEVMEVTLVSSETSGLKVNGVTIVIPASVVEPVAPVTQ